MKIKLSQKELEIIISKMDDGNSHSENYQNILQYLIQELAKEKVKK